MSWKALTENQERNEGKLKAVRWSKKMHFGKHVDSRLHRTGLQCVWRGWEQRGKENGSFLVGVTRCC